MPDIPTVLVMDDDPGVRATMERLLRVYGYGAVTAATLDEARALLGTTAIARSSSTSGSSGESGLDLLATIRARSEFSQAPILIFTGGVLSSAEQT